MANSDAVLRRISTVVENCGRNIMEDHDLTSVIVDLNSCKANLQRIAEAVSAEIYRSIEDSIDLLLTLASRSDHRSSAESVQENVIPAGTKSFLS